MSAIPPLRHQLGVYYTTKVYFSGATRVLATVDLVCGIITGMRKSRVNLPNRCYHLISRVAHRAFFLDDEERTRLMGSGDSPHVVMGSGDSPHVVILF